jgi:P27 family predicted phage terminase small subunit
LPEEGKRYWNDLHPLLERLKVVTEADETALTGLCVTYAGWREAQAFLQEHGTAYKTVSTAGDVLWKRYPQVQIFSDMNKQLRSWLAEFGLTPSARSKVEMVTEKGHDWLDEFLA